MLRTSTLLVSTMLTASLLAAPVLAQDQMNETTPAQEVEGVPPAEGGEAAGGAPVETNPPNAPEQEPAFEEQTRAPQPADMPETATEVFAEGLPHAWAMEFLPDGRVLVNAKAGVMHVVDTEGNVGPEITGLPDVHAQGQGGLLDLALAPDFESSNRIFFSFAEPREDGNGTSVGRATLVLDEDGGGTLEDVEVIFRQTPSYDGNLHFGSRLVFNDEGELFVTVGERSDPEPRVQAQELESGLGKVFRIDETGAAISDNPFVEVEGALPEIWSLGHRNVQAATLDGENRLWIVEHGPRGGDELNQPQPGINYGWPEVTYGIEYSGDPVGEGITRSAETEQPVYYWDPVIAPSGMAYYEGDEFPEWEGAFLVGGLVSTGIVVIHVEDDRVVSEERVPLEARVRDVRVGPDGAVYALTENPNEGSSTIVRVSRAQ
ncbi:PQQ-dependent sugar dehydrogenase [Arsenicitalea aurantiaca]|uniref:PQQ-dependent sugar dehydrogenase n=1 Tax=Arsenicitalea aurantiaca TaxID=1783274 RepID=A0A433X8F0_9HYPH|nr:PQQ-dependent sugar dehydrogenase [Arsenicitalea aurantiaca]RUT30332.1 PQQ-dependent sugar dehydrogenase [Arsenicitalea aurantiaca]